MSDFNAEYGADYEAVPSEAVTWETSQVSFERKETEKKVLFNVKGDMIPGRCFSIANKDGCR